MVKIRVNGVEKTLQKEGQPLTYAGALVLAGFDPALTPHGDLDHPGLRWHFGAG
jgi:hypothetical protein